MTRNGAVKRRSLRTACFKPNRNSGSGSSPRLRGGRSTQRRCSVTPPMGENTQLRSQLDGVGIEYVLSINPDTTIFEPAAVFRRS